MWVRAVGVVCVAASSFVALATSQAHAGMPAPALHEALPDGVETGTVAGATGTTQAFGGSSDCGSYVGLYRIRVPRGGAEAAFRTGGAALCAITLVRSPSNPLTAAGRARGTVAGVACPDPCALKVRLPEGRYVVAVWSHERGRFDYGASVRVERRPSLVIGGHRTIDCRGRREVVHGRRWAAKSSAPSLTVDRASGGRWIRVAERRSGTFAATAASTGVLRITAATEGDASTLPAATVAYVHVVRAPMRPAAGGGVVLAVPFYRQQHRLSCEAAGMRMAVNYHLPGRIGTDMAAQRLIGVDPRRPAVRGGCNPNKAFCGNVNGFMMRDGYGVHAAPVAKAIGTVRPCNAPLLLRGASAATLASHVRNGYPVILWGARPGRNGVVPFHWRAYDGTMVQAYSIEHDWVVVGYHGPATRPTAFVVHNPSGAGNWVVSVAALSEFARPFGGSAVVVR